MKKKQLVSIVLALFSVIILQESLFSGDLGMPNCDATQTVGLPAASSEEFRIQFVTSVMKKKGFLLFFMNPNGRPCQLQGRILEANKHDIEQRYLIKYVKTTNPADHSLFYRFGVRSMPAVILLKNDGTIQHRFPPGILSREQLLKTMPQH